MKNIEQLLNKENWIKYLELADQGGITNHGKAQDIVKEIEEAINYTRCSEQLKDNRTQAFWEWVKVNSMQLKDDGVFYKGNTYLISDLYRKWKREIEPSL